MQNPKLTGSKIVDCIPQTGECPVRCAECFYNGGRFYRTLAEPLFRSPEEAAGKIVRINSGHDSNLDRELVIASTAGYVHKFYNTSIPRFDFPGPVAFTCNGRRLFLIEPPPNLMFVRVRASTWNREEVDKAVEHCRSRHGVPVLLTFMRFCSAEAVTKPEDYEWRKSVLNEYWCAKPEAVVRVFERYKGKGVRMCGTPASSLCVDCQNCELFYWDCLRRVAASGRTPV